MPVSRRNFMRGSAAAVAALAAARLLTACGTDTPRGYGGEPRALPIPPLADAERDGNNVTFRLVAQQGDSQILPDVTTTTWGFNGPHLGPTLRARRGDHVTVEVTNDLSEETAVHWHGMLLPAVADGGPHSPIPPGETWTPSWEVVQPAATLWYHPHTHGLTGLHAYRGLAGMIVLEDDVSDALDIPKDYGVDDIPLVLVDNRFNEDGSFDETDLVDLGLLGDTPTVNGITNAHFDATTRRVRFRILDGSNMRFFNLAFSDERSFHVIASDSGFLAEPLEMTHLQIGPGERAEIVVDVEPGEDISLDAIAFPENMGVPEDEYTPDFGLADSFTLLTISGPDESAPSAPALPGVLDPAAGEPTDTIDAPERTFVLNTFAINDLEMDMQRVDVVIDHDGPEIWEVTNDNSDWPHNFHIHNAHFEVLSLDGPDVGVFTEGRKDTVTLPPSSTARLAVTFGHFTDPDWPYMYHCHMLYHEDSGMMGQFVMVEPGQEPGSVMGPGGAAMVHEGH